MGLLPDYSFKAKLWLSILRRWKPAFVILIIISLLGIIATYNINPVYEAKTKLKFKSNNFTYFPTDLAPNETTLLPTRKQADFIGTEVEVILSDPLIESTVSQLQLKNKQEELLTAEQFKQQLQVNQIEATEIIEVSYQDLDRKIAAQVVNTLVANYIDIEKTELSSNKDFINNQLAQSEKTLEELENSIAKIKEDNQIAAPQEASASLTKTLEEISQQIVINRSEIAKLKSKSKFITEKLGMNSDKALITVKVNQSLTVQNLAEQLQALELKLIKQENAKAEENPKIVEIQREIRAKKESLQKQITAIAGNQKITLFKSSNFNTIQELTLELVQLEASNIGLTEQIQYLVKIEQEKIQKVSLLNELELQLRQLNRKLNTSQNSYQLLLQDLNQIEFVENQNSSNVRVISSEIIPKKVPDFPATYYLASLFLGLIAAIVVIYLLEITDHSLKTLAEAEKFFGYSWLGIIPPLSSQSRKNQDLDSDQNIIPQLIVKEEPISNINESYQVLSANLEFICSRDQLKTIVITSAISQEGKSGIAANLADIMAQKGKNILLIDANLHSPIQGKIWNIYHNIGISNFVAERFSPQSIIQRIRPNLDVIAAGEIKSSTPVILDSPRMQSFLENYSNIYDFILIDSPALDTNADAIALGNIADGTLLIVRSGQVNRSQAKFAKELLAKSGQNILGLVFNEFNPSVTTQNQKSQSTNYLEAAQSESVNVEQSEAGLWETMSNHYTKARRNALIFGLDSPELDDISLAELEENINYLEQDLEKLTQMVKEQEDEFFLQGQIVRRLQKEVNLANISEKANLEEKLLQEQEIKDFLGETLLGQRRNLNQKKEILNQYKEFLLTKKNSEVQLNGN